MRKELRWQWESVPERDRDAAAKRHGLKGPPEVNLPTDLVERTDGLGVFLNPDEGKEIMTSFFPLTTGLQKKGEGLTDDEQDAIRGFFGAEAISPQFVRRVLGEYGDESVKAAFMLRGDLPAYWLEYLLRRHKGQFYRKRYPSMAVI